MANAANKVRYGLTKLYRAKVNRTDEGVTFGNPIRMPGVTSAVITPEGSDASDFYADNGIYFTVPGTNGGYTLELSLAMLDAQARRDILGETLDEATGVQYECVEDEIGEWAYLMEMNGDSQPTGFVFYCGKAQRNTINANTKGESVEVDTDTVTIRCTGVPATVDSEEKTVVKGSIDKTADNAEKYAAFFNAITLPTGASAPTPSA